MASLPSTFSVLNLKFQLKLCESQTFFVTSSNSNIRVSPRCFAGTRVRAAASSNPGKASDKILVIKTKLVESIPEPIKSFPWKKAENAMQERLISLGKKTLKWCFMVWFILSSLSDLVASFGMNQELMIPLGLLIGCFMSDFMKETMPEFISKEERKGWDHLPFVSTTCFFVLVKFVSAFFGMRTRAFLLHAGNGGILQALWLWKNSASENHDS